MKKWIIGSLILIVLMIVAAGVYAQTTDKEKKHHNKSECTFTDKNKDGKCDICGSEAEKCGKENPSADKCKDGSECSSTDKYNDNTRCSSTEKGKDCSGCPSAAGCSESKDEVVPAEKSNCASSPDCANKK